MNPLYRNDPPGQLPPSWYAASADVPPSRPTLRGETTADICVIGAGFTGLSAARHLANRGFDVVVVDAHRVGFGASGRNGGQVGTGYNLPQSVLEDRYGASNARLLWDLAEEAKADIRQNCATIAQGARFRSGVAHGFYAASEAKKYAHEVDHLARNYGYDKTEMLSPEAMSGIVKTPLYCGGLLDMGAGHIHPLRYVFALARAAEGAGARIYETTEVHHIVHGDPAALRTPRGRIMARHVIIAGNGYLPCIARQVSAKVMPINSFICATAPLTDQSMQVLTRDIAVADSKFVVNYYRMSEDNRFLFGGRESYTIGFPRDIQTALVHRMVTLFPQLEGAKIDYVWGGTLGITMPRVPAIQRVAPNVVSAGGFSGHGVALAGLAGKVMAEAIDGHASRFDTLAALDVPNFPGGGVFRAPLLALAMTWYALRDKLGI